MRYQELDTYWKRIFELEWISLCEGSKAIAALIVSDDGTIISEGRNKIGEEGIPNPRVSHAEVEAIRNLDINKYPYVKTYTLYAALEPCPMCTGAIINSRIKRVFIGAMDPKAGAMGSVVDLTDFPFNHKPEIQTGLLAQESQALLKEFFQNLRKQKQRTE